MFLWNLKTCSIHSRVVCHMLYSLPCRSNKSQRIHLCWRHTHPQAQGHAGKEVNTWGRTAWGVFEGRCCNLLMSGFLERLVVSVTIQFQYQPRLRNWKSCKQVKVKVGETADIPLTFRGYLTFLYFLSLAQFTYTNNVGFVIVGSMLSM